MWERLGAGLIDFLVVTLLASVTVRPVLSLFLRHGAEEPRRLDVLLLLVYLAVMWAWKQTTIGNTVFHLRVQRVDGSRLTAGVAVLRTCALLLSLVPLGLGFWWIAWDQRRQAWHDKIVGTQVLKVPAGVQLL